MRSLVLVLYHSHSRPALSPYCHNHWNVDPLHPCAEAEVGFGKMGEWVGLGEMVVGGLQQRPCLV